MALVGGAAATPMLLPLAARAQQKSGMRTVGVVMSLAENDTDSQARIVAFRQAFEELGWKDGQNVRIEYRWTAGKIELVEQYARELVALAPDVILANGSPVVAALHKITGSIPIVWALMNDPVGLGFVKTLARPGGNITGFINIEAPLSGKWIEILKEIVPRKSIST